MTAIQKWVVAGALADPDVVRYAAWISVWGRWFIWLVGVFELAYRPAFWYPHDIELLLLNVLLFSANSLVHHRFLTNRPVTWRWMLFLCTTDLALITANIVIDGGYTSLIFLAYYPSLAVFAVVFSSLGLSLAWITMAAGAYTIACLTAGSSIDLGAGKEKALVARLAAMYTIVLGISLISRFERIRWRSAVANERRLRRERIELSQTIHVTTAQTAYMIGLGIHRARNLADEANEELKAALTRPWSWRCRLGDRRLGEMWPGLPALVVSAYGDEGNYASAMDRGAPGFAVKPVDVVKPMDFDGLRGAMADRTKVVWLERAKSSGLSALRNSLNSLPSPRRQSNPGC